MFDGRMLSAFPAVAQFVFASCLCTKSTEKQSLNRYFWCDDLVFKCLEHYINDMCMCGKRSSSLPKRIKFRQIFLITNWCCTFFFILRLHLTMRRCQKCTFSPEHMGRGGRQSTFDFSENYSVLEEAGFPEVESPAVVIIGWYESAGQCVGVWEVFGIVAILVQSELLQRWGRRRLILGVPLSCWWGSLAWSSCRLAGASWYDGAAQQVSNRLCPLTGNNFIHLIKHEASTGSPTPK